ncbi:MAG: PSD1 and planctomycete cytochrome C domain-containing protein, partial [Planctomycetaceae bacterium]
MSATFAHGAEPVRFSRDVLPLLADRCFACHGPDESHRQADLRLDTREAATASRDGGAAIVPQDPAASELLRRITSTDPAEQMPPPGGGRKALSPAEIARLEHWIAAGAPWGRHWSFEPITRPAVPPLDPHPVDAFLEARLQEAGETLASPAPRGAQLRRLSFDLTGLPPTPEEVAEWLADDSPEAWSRQVERLLASPRFGERMAMWWLDAARYADTDGYQADATRNNWPWRDWVVQSFNAGVDYATFTREQFAGDLLPNATPEQRLATAFHRNHMTNGEGGRDPEESRVDYVIDRVNTVGTVWLGLTLGCCQCHSHKFDPVTQAEYYRFAAFFDSIDEDGRAGGGAVPFLSYRSGRVEPVLVGARQLLATRQAQLARAREEAEPRFQAWLSRQLDPAQSLIPSWTSWQPTELHTVEGTTLVADGEATIRATGANPRQDDYRLIGPAAPALRRVTGVRLRVFPDADLPGPGFSRGATGEFILTDVKLQVRQRGESQEQELALAFASADFSADKKANNNYGDIADTLDDDPRNGWSTLGAAVIEPHEAVFALAQPWIPQPGEELVLELRQRSTQGDRSLARFAVWLTDEAGPVVRQVGPTPRDELARDLVTAVDQIAPALRERLRAQFVADDGAVEQARLGVERAARQLAEWETAAQPVNVMVLAERAQPRTTHVLVRGAWDQKGEVVERGVPRVAGGWPEGLPSDRLGLAGWLTSRGNPLPARVVVNHLWQLLWGEGLVRTPEDLGVQGEFPTHPELLDWLASELLDSGWDLRHVVRLVVSSRAYRQSSQQSERQRERDPGNRLWGRQSRYRRPAWMLRD